MRDVPKTRPENVHSHPTLFTQEARLDSRREQTFKFTTATNDGSAPRGKDDLSRVCTTLSVRSRQLLESRAALKETLIKKG